MSTANRNGDSEDEFESADEGEALSSPVIKSQASATSFDPHVTSINENQVQSTSHLSTVNEGWDDWNIDVEQSNEGLIDISKTMQQNFILSESSSTSKTGSSLSQVGLDDDDDDDVNDSWEIPNKQSVDKESEKHHKSTLEAKLDTEEIKQEAELSKLVDEHLTETVPTAASTIKHEAKDAHQLLDELVAQPSKNVSTWSNPWNNFGSILSTAKQGVSTLTTTVSEGFSAVIETVDASIGAPNPQKLAEMNRASYKIKGETTGNNDECDVLNTDTTKVNSRTKNDSWLNTMRLEKLSNTGMKIVTSSLDVLETVGKKTFHAINEAEPILKGTRRLLRKKDQQISANDAKHESESNKSATAPEVAIFLQLFEKYQGLAHLEALELLSNHSSTILQTITHGNEELLSHIEHYFQIGHDNEVDTDYPTTDVLLINRDQDSHHMSNLNLLSQKLISYQTQLNSTVPIDKLLEVYQAANEFLTEWDWTDTVLDQKTLADEAIDSMALLCSRIIEYYRKTAELILIGSKSLTSSAVDANLLAIYEQQHKDFLKMLADMPYLFVEYMKQTSNVSSSSADMLQKCDIPLKEKLLNEMFIQSSSSQEYASNAYALMKPIVSQSILYHTPTTKNL